jgi:hypothetical protein
MATDQMGPSHGLPQLPFLHEKGVVEVERLVLVRRHREDGRIETSLGGLDSNGRWMLHGG